MYLEILYFLFDLTQTMTTVFPHVNSQRTIVHARNMNFQNLIQRLIVTTLFIFIKVIAKAKTYQKLSAFKFKWHI